jgi:cystathionine gamma-synthase
MDTDSPPGLATLLAQANHFIDPATGAVTPPIVPATTYARDTDYELRAGGLSYSRDQNPSYAQVEALLSRLEGGAAAMLFSSGMAAATALFQTLESEHHVVAPVIMYHGLRDWLNHFCHTRGVALDYVDAAQPGSLERAVRPGHTKLVWIETPANPTWDITDIAAAARLAHQAGARLGVDSTVATPVLTRPLEYGADFVFHSATKFLNGHSDVVAGALVSRVQDEWWDAIRFQRHAGGAACWARSRHGCYCVA